MSDGGKPTRPALRLLDGRYTVCRLPAGATPAPSRSSGFVSWTRTEEESSLVCREGDEPLEVEREPGWRLLQVAGPLDFSEVGILAALAEPLAAADVSIFVISTWETDYLMVRDRQWEGAREALLKAGYSLS